MSLSVNLGLGGESRRRNDQTVTPLKTMNASPAAVPRAASLCLRRNLRARYSLLGGDASTGRCSMYLWISAASSATEAYRRSRAFSRAFIVIQFRSPSTRRRSEAGSVWRRAAISVAAAPIVVSFRESGGASSSRMMRSISAKPACRILAASKGTAADQQLVQEHAERIHIGGLIDISGHHLGLLRTGVLRCARPSGRTA